MEKCMRCKYFRGREGWYCALNTPTELSSRGYNITESDYPSPSEFSCDDYEGP